MLLLGEKLQSEAKLNIMSDVILSQKKFVDILWIKEGGMGHEEKKHKDQEEQEEQYKQEKCDDQGEEQRRGIGVVER